MCASLGKYKLRYVYRVQTAGEGGGHGCALCILATPEQTWTNNDHSSYFFVLFLLCFSFVFHFHSTATRTVFNPPHPAPTHVPERLKLIKHTNSIMCSSYRNKTLLHTHTHTHIHTRNCRNHVHSYLKNCPLNAILFISCIFRFVIIIVLWSQRIINEYVDRPHFAPHHAHYKQRLSRSSCICCRLER